MKRQRAIAAILAATMVIGTSMTAFAAEESRGSTDVTIKVDTTDPNPPGYGVDPTDPDDPEHVYSITVPSALPVAFNADGTNTIPTNFAITNRTLNNDVFVDTVSMEATGGSNWTLAKDKAEVTASGLNSHNIHFMVGKDASSLKSVVGTNAASTAGSATFEQDEAVKVGAMTVNADGSDQSTTSDPLAFKIDRASFTKDEAEGHAFDMQFHFTFVQPAAQP